MNYFNTRSNPLEVYSAKGFVKIWSKFTGEHPCRKVISMNLLCNFIEIALWHGCSPVTLLHIFRTPFYKNPHRGLLLQYFVLLIHSMPLVSFYTSWKHQKTRSFHMFSGGIERNQWNEMGSINTVMSLSKISSDVMYDANDKTNIEKLQDL